MNVIKYLKSLFFSETEEVSKLSKGNNINNFIRCHKTLVIIIIFSILCHICSVCRDRKNVNIAKSYVFVTKWGSVGNGDGEFGNYGGINFKITDKTIEALKNRISNDKLEKLKSLKDKEIDNFIYHRFDSFLLYDIDCSDDEIFIIKKFALPIYHGGTPSLALDQSGYVYISDNAHDRIQKFDSEGKFITKWSSIGNDYITVDLNYNVYACNYLKNYIQKFDSLGNFITRWSIEKPQGITVDKNGYVYVKEKGRYVKKYTPDGKFVPSIYSLYTDIFVNFVEFISNIRDKFIPPDIYISSIRGPRSNDADVLADNITIDKNENLYITFYGRPFWGKETPFWPGVVKYNSSKLGNIYKLGKYGSGDGEFKNFWEEVEFLWDNPIDFMWGIATDTDCNLYVVDKGNSRIQKFDSEGNFITKWGKEGSGDGEFSNPTGIAVDGEGNVYVMDSGNFRVQKFAPKF